MLKRLAGSGSGARKGRRSSRLAMDLNPFRLCSGLKFLGYFMVVLVLALIAVSYYAVVILTLGPHLLHGAFTSLFSILLVAIFHVLVLFFFSPFYSERLFLIRLIFSPLACIVGLELFDGCVSRSWCCASELEIVATAGRRWDFIFSGIECNSCSAILQSLPEREAPTLPSLLCL